MLFCQSGHAQSLREMTGGLAACEGKLHHLGVEDPPKRATLSYANGHRPWQLCETVFHNPLKRCQAEAKSRKRGFRFKRKNGPSTGTSAIRLRRRFRRANQLILFDL